MSIFAEEKVRAGTKRNFLQPHWISSTALRKSFEVFYLKYGTYEIFRKRFGTNYF